VQAEEAARRPSTFYALGAIALWAALASLGISLSHVPPFLLTGIALLIGSVPAWPLYRQWKVSASTLALGVYGLFGYHFLLFIALRLAPPVEANLVNYLWPLFIVVLAPLLWPLGKAVGMDQVHFCIFMITTLGLGFITPPFGLNLFVMSGLTRVPIAAIALRALPFALVMVAVSALIGFVPGISTFMLKN